MLLIKITGTLLIFIGIFVAAHTFFCDRPKKSKELLNFLGYLLGKGTLTQGHYDNVIKTWIYLKKKIRNLGDPLTQITSEGALQFAWDKDGNYLDIDIYPNGHIAWFYRNRFTREVEGTEDELLPSISEEIIYKLKVMNC